VTNSPRRIFLSALVSLSVMGAIPGRPQETGQQNPACGVGFEAVEVVENVWHIASQGGLLTTNGWQRASGSFTKPTPIAPTVAFTVMSNSYGVSHAEMKEGKVEVLIESEELGRIDPQLRFVATPATHNPDFYLYRLVFGPTPVRMYGPDGKTLIEEKMTGPNRWRIEGSLGYRWTTVNTAIRYIMDTRDKSTDPLLRANAEKTLETLRKYK
jgi:hypothetical protein